MGEIKGQSMDKRTVTVNEPYLLDADEVVDRMARFQAIYQERASSIGGQQWRYRRTGLLRDVLGMTGTKFGCGGSRSRRARET